MVCRRRPWLAAVRVDEDERETTTRGKSKRTCADARAGRRAPALSRLRRSRPARRAGPLRSRARQGFLRRRLHRRHQGPQVAPDRRGRAAHPAATSSTAARSAPIRAPATAPASWCRSRTSSSRARPKDARHHAAGARRIRRRRSVHAARRGAARDHPQDLRAGRGARGPEASSAGATCRPTTRRSARR